MQLPCQGKRTRTRLWADVSLSAKPFFSRSGFAVEACQQVQVRDVVLANTHMGNLLLY